MNERARKPARVLWDYHNLAEELPNRVDVILAMGSHDDRVAHCAADLMIAGKAPLLVTSGGFGKVTSAIRSEPEGERFKRIIAAMGVEEDAILVEPAAKNTGDNITLTRALLAEEGRTVHTAIIVTKPYMKRRALSTSTKQWPEIEWWVTAPEISFEAYPTDDVPERRMIELMVGDLQRIKVFAEQGFQTPQEIPADVWEAYEELVELGYDTYVIKAP